MNATPLNPVYFLLVDDLEENLLSLEALLRKPGLVLLKARSGPQALELLLEHEVALAMLDVQMPGMDGFELAELMRGTARTRRVPIIFLTAGSADRQRRFRGYEAGAVDFLHKPIEPDILRSKADVFFELYRQQQLLEQQRDALKISSEENAALLTESRHYAEALTDADRRKDEFLATLAHELRNPLAPIRNGLQILRMDPGADASGELREMMDRQLTHLVRLIDDLLDVSRVSKGKIELRREALTLQIVVQAAVEACQPFINAGQHQLTVEISEEPLWLEADLTRMAQVITNLLNNASKYTPEGGHITIRATATDDKIIITVADNGLGIPADMLPKVFELFTQVDRHLERAQGGLGIGLALVQRLVEMHGGGIEAQSAGLGQGSQFIVTLPRSLQAPASVEAPPMAEDTKPFQPLRVLVIDDNLASAQTTGWMLELMGHTPSLGHDGPEAIALAQSLRPDAILLDIGLPGMSGYDVCRTLRTDASFKDTVMIAQTGWGQERDRQEAYAAGFDHHLVKPVKLEALEALLASIQPK